MAVQPYYSVFVFWLIVLLLIGDEIQAREIVTNKDSTFVVAFPAQEPSAESKGSNKLFLTSDEDAYALITIPSMKGADKFVRLRPGGTMRVELPGSVRMTSKTGLGPKKGINIFSNSSISVYGVSMVQHSSDGFLALPLSLLSLGNEYMVVTYKPVMNSFVMVTAKHDNTDVTFHLKLSGSGEVNVEGLKYKNGDNFSVSLQALDSFQLLADDLAGSLTGTRITSTKTLSVYSGNDCANIPEKSRSCDHLLEQMTPIATWGNVFLVKSTAYRGAGDVFYILASQDQTKITIELQKPFYTTINASQFYEYQSNPGASVVIRTSKPALVVQFGKSHSVDNSKFAPFMSIVPPNDQWSNDYTLVVPTAASGAQGAPSPFKCFANLFAETRQTKEIESKPAVNIAWQPIPFSLYSSATVNLTSGQYRLYHKSPLKFFSAMFLCNADYEAYGFPAGLRIFRRSSKCQYPNMIPADRRDNDCDDRADEELLNGIDDDGDGKFDEDLATPIPVLQAPGNVVESRCYEPMYLSRIASTPPYIAFGMCNIRGDLKIVYRDVSLSSQGCYARKNRTWTLTDGCLNTIRQSQIVSTYLKEPLMVEFPRFIPSESCNYYNLGHNYDSGKPTIVSNCPGNLTITHHDVGWENMPKCSYTHSVSVNRTWIVTNGCTTVTGVQIITLKLQGHRPYVKVQNQPVLSAAGKNITLGCEISGGAPKPTVTWVMPDGQTVNKTNSIHDIEVLDDLSKRHRIKSVLDDNSLLIAGTRVRDTGIYQCVASNPLGKSTGTVNVTIHDDLIDVDASVTIKDLKFNPNLNKPILDEELDHEIIELKRKIKNQLTQVFINMTGFQEVKILGFRNGSVKVLFRVVIKKQNKDENPQVVVSKVGQRLAVTVKSGNLGDYKIVPVMELREKPPPPKNVKANEVKESTVHISWVPPDFIAMYAISGYILQYKIFGDDHWMTYDTVKGDNHRIGGLNPGTGYQIRTKAQNKYGHSEPSSSLEITTLDEGLTGTQIALIIIIPLVVIIICVVTWYIYGKRRKSTAFQRTPSDNHLLDTGVVRYSRPKDLIQINENHQWKEIDRNALELGRVLGEGEFGMVIEGKLTQKDGTVTRCAVKKLKQTATESDMKDLLNELDIMEQVGNHPNIVNLIGACAFGGPILVVVEFCANGNLLRYLQKQSTRTYEDMTEYQIHISPRERLKIAGDVANGMAHLARRRCVHRDLAARNVLLDEKFTAKVSDFGLSRDVYTDNVYEKTTGGKLPAKWMAIEALEAGMNTTQSDIWSFGVLLWEIETGGCIPYPAFSAMEMLAALKQGYRLERPSSCSISLYNIMLKCWEADPSLRPSFDGLYLDLHQLQNNTSSPSYYENMNDTEHLTETYA